MTWQDREGTTPGTARILVVTGDAAVGELVSTWLEAAGHHVRRAENVPMALEAIRQDCPQVLITDWEVEHSSGIELTRAVRREPLPHQIHVLFLAPGASNEELTAAQDAGANDFLAHTIDQRELLARVRHALGSLELLERHAALADRDPLTETFNRRAFIEQCQREIDRAKRYHQALSCALLDIDLFKDINDTYGHAIGDAALRAVADVLRSEARRNDFVCRYGGDEFALILPQTSEVDAAFLAERIRLRIGDLELPGNDRPVRLKATIGVAQLRDNVDSPQGMADMADQALLTAKHAGRDRVQRFSSLGHLDTFSDVTLHGDRRLPLDVRVGEVMTSPVASLREQDPLQFAADLFLRLRINSAPVVDDSGKLSGILSEQDLLKSGLSHTDWQTPIRDIMKANVVYYDEQTPVVRVWEFLCRVTIRRVIVVNKQHMPVGVVSRGSLLRWMGNWGTFASHRNPPCGPSADLVPGESLRRSAQAIRAEAQRLDECLAEGPADVAPLVVHAATRIQEHAQDLLALSQMNDHFRPNPAPSRPQGT